MAKSKLIHQWLELVRSCHESGQSKAAFLVQRALIT